MPERFIIQGCGEFVGKHCETTALKRVLDYHGLSLSEEMLLGLGGGVGRIDGRGGKRFAETPCVSI